MKAIDRVARAQLLRRVFTGLVAVGTVSVVVSGVGAAPWATATPTPVNLGSATSFAVLASSTVTNTGSSVITDGDVGVSSGSSITGFYPSGPGLVVNGTEPTSQAVATQAQTDLTTAYGAAATALSTAPENNDLGGLTLTSGVYTASSSMTLNGPLTLSGTASSVFIFQAGTTLLAGQTGPASVLLTGGVQACNVFWQVGSSATLGTLTTSFVGSILAADSATLDTGASVTGRVLAQTGAVTLNDNAVTVPTCSDATTSSVSSASATVGNSINDVATVTGNASDGTPAGTVEFYECGPPSASCSSTAGTALMPAETLTNGTAASPSFTPVTAGTYCFAAVFTPDLDSAYGASSETGTPSTNECSTFSSVVTAPPTPSPTVLTSSVSDASVTVGSSVNDVATVTGNVADGAPTGTVQFYKCGPGSTSCSPMSGTPLNPLETLNGGTAASPDFTPGTVGTYCFATIYEGNTLYAASSETGTPADDECTTVTAASTSTSTGTGSPTGTATGGSSSAGSPTGTATGGSTGAGPSTGTGSTGTAVVGSSSIVGETGVVPLGSPQTGFGGASHSRDGTLLVFGVLAIVASGLVAVFALRRRRFSFRRNNGS